MADDEVSRDFSQRITTLCGEWLKTLLEDSSRDESLSYAMVIGFLAAGAHALSVRASWEDEKFSRLIEEIMKNRHLIVKDPRHSANDPLLNE